MSSFPPSEYPPTRNQRIFRLTLTANEKRLRLTLSDNGLAFNRKRRKLLPKVYGSPADGGAEKTGAAGVRRADEGVPAYGTV